MRGRLMGARQFKVVLVGGHTVGSYALIGSAAEACRPWLDKNYPVVIRQDTGHTIEIRPGTPPSIVVGRGLRTPPEWADTVAQLLNATIAQPADTGAP